jgi:RimJ/RimL family protein N-acetyltransferase
MLEYLTVVDQVNHVAWIAVDPASPAEAGLGIARFIRLVDEPEVAEMALTVVDRYQGKGLGAALLNILLVRAERLSVRTLRAVVLPENYRVIRWMGRIGATSVWRDGLIEVNLAVEGNHVPELEPAIGGKINMPALAVDG